MISPCKQDLACSVVNAAHILQPCTHKEQQFVGGGLQADTFDNNACHCRLVSTTATILRSHWVTMT